MKANKLYSPFYKFMKEQVKDKALRVAFAMEQANVVKIIRGKHPQR